MKPHPKIRKTVKWAGAVVSALLVVVWAGSAWWSLSCERFMSVEIDVTSGCLFLRRYSEANHTYRLQQYQQMVAGLRAGGQATAGPEIGRTYGMMRFLNKKRTEVTHSRGWSFESHGRSLLLWYYADLARYGLHVRLPLWTVIVPVAGATTIAWRHDVRMTRRKREGICPKCSYNRHGLPAQAVCPECGAAPAAMSTPSATGKDVT